MGPSALGIQSIIIGSAVKEEETKNEEVKNYTQDYQGRDLFYTIVDQDYGQPSESRKSAKLEPIRPISKNKQKLDERMRKLTQQEMSAGEPIETDDLGLKKPETDKDSLNEEDVESMLKSPIKTHRTSMIDEEKSKLGVDPQSEGMPYL